MAQQIKDDWKPEDTEVWEPEPRKVTPGQGSEAPSDAIVLFDGSDLSAWKSQKDGGEAPWKVEDGHFTVVPGSGGIETKENFGDFQLHIEWRSPQKVESEGQGRGNSGVFLQGMYEVQVLDSYNNRTYSNGQAGSVYKQQPPMVNAMRPVDEWEVYDIIYTAPRFDEVNGALLRHAKVTVLHNGVVVQNAYEIKGTTEYIGPPKIIPHGDGPIALQDHSNTVSFRNIWIRKLD
jgi:hypothetical protein